MRVWFCLVGLLVVGCGGSGDPAVAGDMGSGGGGAGGGGGGGGPVGDMALAPAVDVTGAGTTKLINDSAEQDKPIAFSSATVAALIPDGNGGFTTVAGTGTANGTFTIPSVPQGARYIEYAPTGGIPKFRWTDANSVDFTTFANGRSDLVLAPANTTLTFNVTNLNAWQVASNGNEQDMLELFTSGGNVYINGVDSLLTTGLSAGATTLADTTSDIHFYSGGGKAGLIDGSKGDTALLTQLVYHTLGDGTPYNAVAKSLALGSSFMEMGGASSTISGAFTDVPQNQTYSAVFKRSAFQAYKAAINPNASCSESINLSAVPGLATYGNVVTSADLLQVSPTAGSTDITLTNVAYGNPYPSWDGVAAFVAMGCSVSYSIGMATTPATLYGRISVSGPTVGGTVTPVLSPATSPTIAGKDAFANNTGVGLAPTIAWHAPAIGSPTSATIDVVQLTLTNGSVATKFVAVLEVDSATQTSLQVPSGVLTSGGTYAFVLYLSQGMPTGNEADASLVSGTFTP